MVPVCCECMCLTSVSVPVYVCWRPGWSRAVMRMKAEADLIYNVITDVEHYPVPETLKTLRTSDCLPACRSIVNP